MAIKNVSASFVHAALHAFLQVQLCEHLFPQKRPFELSQDQRRILVQETNNVLLQAKWQVNSTGFAAHFAGLLTDLPEAPPETILGEKLSPSENPPPASPPKSRGDYL
jgi:hypothetical protein